MAYLDILGFSEVVARSASSPAKTDVLERILRGLNWRPGGFARPFDYQFQSFSDSIVFSVRVQEGSLGYLLQQTCDIVVWLLGEKMLTRGAIAKDALIHEAYCGFRRKRPPIPIEGGQCSDRLRTAFR